MAQFRGGLIIDVEPGSLDDDRLGSLLDALKEYNGALVVEPDRAVIAFSFDSADLPGVASGLAAAIPRVVSVAQRLLTAGRLIDLATVVGFSIERVADQGG